MEIIKNFFKSKNSLDEMRSTLQQFEYNMGFVDNNERNSTTIFKNKDLQMEHVVIHTEPNTLHDLFILDIESKKQTDFLIKYFKTVDSDIEFLTILSYLEKNDLDFVCQGSTDKDIYLEKISGTKFKMGIIDYNFCSANSILDIQTCFNDLVMSIKLIPMFFNIAMCDFLMTPATIDTKFLGKKVLNMEDFNDFFFCKTELAQKFIVEGKHKKHDIDFNAHFENGFKNINFIYSIKKENRGLVNVLLKILKQPIISSLGSESFETEPEIWGKLYNDFYNKEKSELDIKNIFIPSYVKGKTNFKRYNATLKVVDDETKIYFKLELKEYEYESRYSICNDAKIEILK